MSKNKVRPVFIILHKINSKWIKNSQFKTRNTDNVLRKLSQCSTGKNFLNKIPFAQELRPKTEKWGHIQLICFCVAKKSIN